MGIRKGSPYKGLYLGTNVYKARPETHFLQSTTYKVRPRHLQLKGKNRSRALKRRRSFEKDHSFVLGKTKIYSHFYWFFIGVHDLAMLGITVKVEQPKAFLLISYFLFNWIHNLHFVPVDFFLRSKSDCFIHKATTFKGIHKFVVPPR